MSEVIADGSVAGARIKSFVERVEQLETEKGEIAEQIREVFAEAKGEGYDVAVLKDILKMRRQDRDALEEHETLRDIYLRAIETAST